MRSKRLVIMFCACIASLAAPAFGQRGGAAGTPPAATEDDPVKTMVDRLDLEKYKTTIKGLTQFGDRRQGTERNRKAVDWIEAQLKSYGCPTERIKYEYSPPPQQTGGRGRGNTGLAQGGGRPRGIRTPTGV